MSDRPPSPAALAAETTRNAKGADRVTALGWWMEVCRLDLDLSSEDWRIAAVTLLDLSDVNGLGFLAADLSATIYRQRVDDLEASLVAYETATAVLDGSSLANRAGGSIWFNYASTLANLKGDAARTADAYATAFTYWSSEPPPDETGLSDDAYLGADPAEMAAGFAVDHWFIAGRVGTAAEFVPATARRIRRLVSPAAAVRFLLVAASNAHVEAPDLARAWLKSANRRAKSLHSSSRRAVALGYASFHLDSQKVGQAIRWARRAVAHARDAGDPEGLLAAYRLLSQTLARRGRLEEAIEPLQNAVDAGADSVETTFARIELATLNVYAADDPSLLDALLDEIERAEDRFPDPNQWAWAHRNLLAAHASFGNLDAVTERASRIADRVSTEEASSVLRLAVGLLVEGDPSAAAALAARFTTDHEPGELALAAEFLAEHGERSAAGDLWTTAVAASDDPETRFHVENDRAIFLSDVGKHAESIDALERCLLLAKQLDRRDLVLQAHFNLGETLRRFGHPENAMEHLRAFEGLATNDQDQVAVRSLFGLALNDLGRHEKASAAFRSVIDTADEPAIESDGHAGLGAVATNTGDYRAAAEHYRAASDLRGPGDRRLAALHGLAFSLVRLHRHERGEPSHESPIAGVVSEFLSGARHVDHATAAEWASSISEVLAEGGYAELAGGSVAYAVLRALLVIESDDAPYVNALSTAYRHWGGEGFAESFQRHLAEYVPEEPAAAVIETLSGIA